MAATARLIVQMTPRQKSALEKRARKAGVSTAEFVRRRVGPDDLEDHRQEIEALLTTLEKSAPSILQALADATESARAAIGVIDKTLAKPRP